MADCTESLPEFLHPEEGMVQRQVNILTQSLNDAPTFGKAGTALETECILAGRLEQRFQHGRYPPVLLNGGQPGFVGKVPGYCPLQVDGLSFHRQLAGRTGSNIGIGHRYLGGQRQCTPRPISCQRGNGIGLFLGKRRRLDKQNA